MDRIFFEVKRNVKTVRLNYAKKFSALFLVLAMLSQLVGCSDKSWCLKDSSETLPVGVYIYNMYMAYQEAYYKVNENYTNNLVGNSTSSTKFLEQTIDEQPVLNWIQDKAMKNTKMIVSIDENMKELGIDFTDEEEAAARQTGDANWQKLGANLQNYGISRNSFDIATGIMSAKYDKLFDAIYGANGTEAVADSQIRTYFSENFIDYSYIKKDVLMGSSYQIVGSEVSEIEDEEVDDLLTETTQSETTTTTAESSSVATTSSSSSSSDDTSSATSDSSNSTTTNISEDEENAKKQFAEYENMIAQGSTMEDVDAKYQQDEELTESQLESATEDINSSELPQEVKDAYASIANNSAKTVKTDDAYYLIYKKDISKQLSKLDDEDFQRQVLKGIKDEEYSDKLESDIDGLDIEINQAAMKEYTPYMFEKDSKK